MLDAEVGFDPGDPALHGGEFGEIEAAFMADARIGDEADVDVAALDAQIANARSDASDPGDETRRARAAERLEYLEALKAAVGGAARH